MCATPASQYGNDYDPFAWIYDRSMAEDFYRRALPVVKSLLLDRLPAGACILDLCCGSGQMAQSLSTLGFQVTGLDLSEQMLSLAREKAPHLPLILCDVKHFSLQPVFDGIISIFNSLAHTMRTDDLQRIFQNAQSALKTGGTFVFDLTMEDGYTAKWRGSFGEVHESVAWTVRPSYDARSKLACNDVTVFRRQAGDLWQRSDFRITQKCHAEHEIRNSLHAAGFRRIDSYDAERDLGMAGESGRTFFVAA